MFESYDLEEIYIGTVKDHGVIIGMENMGGCLGITSVDEPKYYETLLYKSENGYKDLYHIGRVVNSEIQIPSRRLPVLDKNHHLYTACEDTLVKYAETIRNEEAKVLQRMPFNKYRLK